MQKNKSNKFWKKGKTNPILILSVLEPLLEIFVLNLKVIRLSGQQVVKIRKLGHQLLKFADHLTSCSPSSRFPDFLFFLLFIHSFDFAQDRVNSWLIIRYCYVNIKQSFERGMLW